MLGSPEHDHLTNETLYLAQAAHVSAHNLQEMCVFFSNCYYPTLNACYTYFVPIVRAELVFEGLSCPEYYKRVCGQRLDGDGGGPGAGAHRGGAQRYRQDSLYYIANSMLIMIL